MAGIVDFCLFNISHLMYILGGIFGLYDGTIDKEIQSNSRCNKIQHLNDVLPNNNW